MSELDICLEIIEKIENRSYRGKNRVVITLDDVASLVDFFAEADGEDQTVIKECISENVGRVLISFTGNMAKKAVEFEDKKWLERALLIHILEDIQFDDRENLQELFLLNPAFESLNISKDEICNNVMHLASDRVKKYLLSRF